MPVHSRARAVPARTRAALGAAITATAMASLVCPVTANARPSLEDPLDSVVGVVSQPFTITTSIASRFALRVSTRIASVPGARLEFRLHRRIAGRGPFRAIAAGDAEAAVIDSLSYPLSGVPRTNSGLFTEQVSFRTSGDTASSLTVRFPGVYPLSVRVVDETGAELARTMTFLNRRSTDDPGPAVQATAFARLAPPPSLTTDGLVAVQEPTRAAVQRFINFLEAAPDNITVCLEPELVASLATSIEPVDTRLFADLRNQLSRRSVIAASFAQSDPSVMAARGLGDEFIAQVRFGERILNRFLPGVPIRRTTWVALGQLDERGLGLLRDAGIGTVLISTATQADLPSGRPTNSVTRIIPTSGAEMPAISIDQGFAEQLSMANLFPQQVAHRIAAEALVTRDEILASGSDPSRVRLVVGSPSGVLYDDSTLLVAARLLRAAPGVTFVDMSGAQSATPNDPVMSLPPSVRRPDDGLTTVLRSLRSQLDSVLSMVPDDDPQRDTWRHMLGLATSSSGDPAEWADALRTSLDSTLDAVSIATPGSINLSSRTGNIRFQVRNNSQHNLTVRIRLTSAKLNVDKRAIRVSLASGTTSDVQFSATTRTNGTFPVVVRVTTPDGNIDVVPAATFTARVSALAGFGQLASITFLLMLLAWWWTHRRKARRDDSGQTNSGNSAMVDRGSTVLPL